ncbi:MAG: hypothetical protein GXY05_06800 [Clostridiales bacterium]|nr:hypothetical protein [Clostridiales bacterium]
MYEAYTIFIFVLVIAAVLFGILCGFYAAFRVAERNKDGDNTETKPPLKKKNKEKSQKDNADSSVSSAKGLFTKRDASMSLQSKIHNQSGMSYTEFKTYDSVENHDEALLEARIKQDAAYSYIGKKISSGT